VRREDVVTLVLPTLADLAQRFVPERTPIRLTRSSPTTLDLSRNTALPRRLGRTGYVRIRRRETPTVAGTDRRCLQERRRDPRKRAMRNSVGRPADTYVLVLMTARRR
jgi:hypothetical protein